MRLSRRELALAGAAFAAAGGARAAAPDPLSGDRLFLDLARYAAFGPKRTGGEADHAVSRWMAEEARAAGAQVELTPFTTRQFMLDRSVLVVGGRAYDTLPFWFPRPTEGVISASLTVDPAAARGKVLLVSMGEGIPGLRAMPPALQAAARAGAAAVVFVAPTPSGELYGHGQVPPTPLPALVVGGRDGAALRAAATAGGLAHVEIAGRIVDRAEAFNVLARVPGSGPLLVVTTPTSAWLTSGGERGPGVALWLGLLRRAVTQRRGNWLFAAFSGHELRGVGAHAFLESERAPKPQAVKLWCHLGASIAARGYRAAAPFDLRPLDEFSGQTRLLTNRADWAPVLGAAFAHTSFRPQTVTDPMAAVGELQLYFGKGYPAFGFEGGHDYFHAPGDTAAVSSPQLLAAAARGIVGTLERLGA